MHYLKAGIGTFASNNSLRGIGMNAQDDSDRTDPAANPAPAGGRRPPLTRREREILGLLAEGMSGAQIAAKLVLSPETVRTHVRNAMTKLGASTRSQAVALALQSHEIPASVSAGAESPASVTAEPGTRDHSAALGSMLDGLVSLYDLDGGAVYLIDEDGLSLRRVAAANGGSAPALPEDVALGDGALGRVALERRSQLVHGPAAGGSSNGAMLAAPMISGGRLFGVIALAARVSRPIGRSELLLLQAFSVRVGDILLAGQEVDRRLDRAMERFRGSWSTATRVA
jgi:DNA-binding CsgD family transcriptional regulator